jgi:cytochrome b561
MTNSPAGTPMPAPTNTSPAPFRYDRKTIALHWWTAALVALLWLIAQVIDDFPRGPWRVNMRSVHITLGITLAIVLLLRLMWRNLSKDAHKAARNGVLEHAAAIGHFLLYALAISTVLLGLVNASIREDYLFNLFAIPSLAPSNPGLREYVGAAHGWAANALAVLAVAHSLTALFHHYLLRDSLLWRMIPVSRLAQRER